MPKIAVVEDDHALNDQHREMLSQIPNADIHQAYSTIEARTLIAQGDFDLLVLDIELEPGTASPRGGFDILIEYGSRMSIIIVTGMPEPNLHEIAIKLKAFEFVRKPVNTVDFMNKVQHALGFRSSEAIRESRLQQSWPEGLSIDATCPPNVLWRGSPVNLTMIELTMVHTLAQQLGRTVTYQKLAAALKSGSSSRVVNQHMSGVRGKFAEVDRAFDRIGTDPGKGYFWATDGR